MASQIGCLFKGLQLCCCLQRVTGLDQAQAFAKHFAGILVAAGVDQDLNDTLMMSGEDLLRVGTALSSTPNSTKPF